MAFVRQTYPAARFEVLYPPDTNDTALNRLVNYPATWTPATLACLKTENFTYTGNRNLDKAQESILTPKSQRISARRRAATWSESGDYTSPWSKEQRMAQGEGVESVVLFALDQFCLIGYALPLDRGPRSSAYMG